MRIIVVCGAGASSTFVAMRVRRTAASRGSDVTATAVPLETLDAALADADVLLLGAHLVDSAADIAQRASRAGVALALLPEHTSSAQTGDDALDLALAAAEAHA